jgi:GntR family transcriptional regulator
VNGELSRIRLNTRDGRPKYLVLRDALADQIAKGRWAAGSQLPAEDQLAEMASLSLGTVQRSLRMLADEGIVVRRHGIGTFVSDEQRPLGGPFRHFRFLDDATGETLPIYTRVVARYRVREAGRWTPLLDADEVVCIERTFSINREFELFVRLYFDATRFPDLVTVRESSLNGVSFKELLDRQYHQPTASYELTLQVLALPKEVCAALSLKSTIQGSLMEIVAHGRTSQALYVQDVFIPPNGRRLMISG